MQQSLAHNTSEPPSESIEQEHKVRNYYRSKWNYKQLRPKNVPSLGERSKTAPVLSAVTLTTSQTTDTSQLLTTGKENGKVFLLRL